MGFGEFAMGYLLGQSFSGPTNTEPYMIPGKCLEDFEAEKDPEIIAAGQGVYWMAFDEAYWQETLNELNNNAMAGLETAKTLGTTRERLIEEFTKGEIQIFAVLEPTIICEMPKMLCWIDENRIEAQGEEYIKYLLKVKEIVRTYESKMVYAPIPGFVNAGFTHPLSSAAEYNQMTPEARVVFRKEIAKASPNAVREFEVFFRGKFANIAWLC